MRLDQALVSRALCESRTEAQELIREGFVFVEGVVSMKQTKQVLDSDSILVTARRKYVSRGGEKLEGAFLDIVDGRQLADGSDPIRELLNNKSALDVGSSTGGFTDFLLQHGIAHVDCVDVGTSQLHSALRGMDTVSLYENIDIRIFKTVKKYDIIVADLSFIPLEHVLKKIVSFGAQGCIFFILIKPQFEVGKGNTKKGIVKNKSLIMDVLNKYKNKAIELLGDVKVFPSVIIGGDGNQEYFLYGKSM